jgi:hypothetical protein
VPVLDEVLVLVLVPSHVQQVLAAPSPEVEHHLPMMRKPSWEKKIGGETLLVVDNTWIRGG